MIKKLNKKVILGAGILGTGLYLLLFSNKKQETPLGSGGMLGGKDIDEELGYGETQDTAYIPYPTNETQPQPFLADTPIEPQTATSPEYQTSNTRPVGSTAPVTFGEYTGTATKLTDSGKMYLDFGSNAKAITMTKSEVQQKSSGTPFVALQPVGTSVSDAIRAGNVASIIAKSSSSSSSRSSSTPLYQSLTKNTFTPITTISDTKTPTYATPSGGFTSTPSRITSYSTSRNTPPPAPKKTTPPPAPKTSTPKPRTTNYFRRFTTPSKYFRRF